MSNGQMNGSHSAWYEMGWYGMRKNGFPPLYVSTATWHKSEGAHSSEERIDGSISTVSRAWHHLALGEEDAILQMLQAGLEHGQLTGLVGRRREYSVSSCVYACIVRVMWMTIWLTNVL
jgi:hypothetical protein